MTEVFVPYRPQPLDWRERERVGELHEYLGCTFQCRYCHEQLPADLFPEPARLGRSTGKSEVCMPCRDQRRALHGQSLVRSRWDKKARRTWVAA